MFDGNVSAQGSNTSLVPRFARNLDDAIGLRELDGLLGELRHWATACRGSSKVPSTGGGESPHARRATHCLAMNHGSLSARSMTTLTMYLGLSLSFRTPSQRELHSSMAERESHASGGLAPSL